MDEAVIRGFLRSDYPRVVAASPPCAATEARPRTRQEALARAWDRGRHGLTVDSLPAWVTAVAMNITRSAARSALRRRRSEERALRGPEERSRRGSRSTFFVRSTRSRAGSGRPSLFGTSSATTFRAPQR